MGTAFESLLPAKHAVQNFEPFVDAERAAEFLGVTRRRVLELARANLIPAYPLGSGKRKVWRFRLSELQSAMLNSQRQFPAPERRI